MHSGSALHVQTFPAPLRRGLIFIDAMQTNSAFYKMEYYSQHNVLHYEYYHYQTKIFSQSYLLILFKV